MHHPLKVEQPAQTTLMRNLLPIDVQLRRAEGERPTAEQYTEQFPSYSQLIKEAFQEPSAVSIPTTFSIADGGQATGGKLVQAHVPAASLLGDYQLVRKLGRGEARSAPARATP